MKANNKYQKGDSVRYLGRPATITAVRPNGSYKVRYLSNDGTHTSADYVNENTITR